MHAITIRFARPLFSGSASSVAGIKIIRENNIKSIHRTCSVVRGWEMLLLYIPPPPQDFRGLDSPRRPREGGRVNQKVPSRCIRHTFDNDLGRFEKGEAILAVQSRTQKDLL